MIENAEMFNGPIDEFKNEKQIKALETFWPLFDWIKKSSSDIPAESFIGFCCSTVSNIGHVFWDKQDILKALTVFEFGIKFIEGCFDNIRTENFDFHNPNHAAVFYVIEDYASIKYTLDDKKESEKYFTLLKSIDKHNHLRADIALVFIKQGISWNEYVDYLDKVVLEYGGRHEGDQSAVS